MRFRGTKKKAGVYLHNPLVAGESFGGTNGTCWRPPEEVELNAVEHSRYLLRRKRADELRRKCRGLSLTAILHGFLQNALVSYDRVLEDARLFQWEMELVESEQEMFRLRPLVDAALAKWEALAQSAGPMTLELAEQQVAAWKRFRHLEAQREAAWQRMEAIWAAREKFWQLRKVPIESPTAPGATEPEPQLGQNQTKKG